MIALLVFLFGVQAFAESTIVSGCEPGVQQFRNSPTTRVALMYAHGFSACPLELEPVFTEVGNALEANTLKILLAGHGIPGGEALRGVKVEDWQSGFASGIDALGRLGKKRVVVATSTGASLALDNLAAHPTNADALVLISPNFGVHRWDAELLLLPWGIAELLVRFVVGEYREWQPRNAEHGRYWMTKYPTSALIEMMKTVRLARDAPLEKIKIPTLVLYCDADYVLDVGAMKKNVARIGGPSGGNVRMTQAPCDEDTHVLAGKVLAPRSSEAVSRTIVEFLKDL